MTDRPDIPEEAVERAAEALWNERERRDPTGDAPDDWYPPGDNPDQQPPREPFLWEQMVAEGKYGGDQEETRADARAVLQAAAPALRKQGAEEAEPKPGVMHPVDQAFYDLTVKERDAERVRVDRLKVERDQALAKGAEEERERLARRCEDVYAALADLQRKRERDGKDNSAAYLQGRRHEASNQAAALRELATADHRANVWGDALEAVVGAARSWLVREHGDTRPTHADDGAAALFDALEALAALDTPAHSEPEEGK